MPHHKLKATVLIVDDTEDIRELLSVILQRHGFHVVLASNGAELDQVLAKRTIDLIILDIMMPGEDGLAICKRLRATASPPIILLSAKDEAETKVIGLDLGAEDYVCKPFSPEELVARVRVVLRRAKALAKQLSGVGLEWVRGWRLDSKCRSLTSPENETLTLSGAEYAVLRVLVDNPTRPLKRELILHEMRTVHGHATPRSLDKIVSRLRQRLRDVSRPEADDLIQTVYGVGYMLKPGT